MVGFGWPFESEARGQSEVFRDVSVTTAPIHWAILGISAWGLYALVHERAPHQNRET